MGELRSVLSFAGSHEPAAIQSKDLQLGCSLCGSVLGRAFYNGEPVAFHRSSVKCIHDDKLIDLKSSVPAAIPEIFNAEARWEPLKFRIENHPESAKTDNQVGSLLSQLVLAASALAEGSILCSDLRGPEGQLDNANQVCVGCAMHSRGRKLTHTPSCAVGCVLSIIEQIAAHSLHVSSLIPIRKEEAPTEMPSAAEAGASPHAVTCEPVASEFGEPWRYKQMIAGGVHVVTPEGYLVASLHGAAQEQLDHAERIAACINFCAGIPTELLDKEKPLADITRDINQVIAVGRLLPGLSGVSR